MNQNFVIIITLWGGLSVFIYGMIMMSGGLQKVAGERMKSFLAIFTRNRVIGVLAGAMVTVVLQSSSATTVMVVGFASAGLIKLPQAISVILGANIGTTVTAQLIAFKVGDFAWIFVALGFILYFFVKRENIKNVGESIFAFGLLFVGINTMGNAMAPLSQSEGFSQLILNVSDSPALGVAVGAGLTVVVQASAAVIAVLQKLASTMGPDGVNTLIGLEGAIPVLFGTNIGTTITAILASFGASVNAKRAALAHVLFNLSGTIAFMFFIPLYTKAVLFISPIGTEIEVISRQIANAHFLFNFIATLLWLPFVGVLVKVVTKLIPGEDQVKPCIEPVFLDYKVINTPLFAMHLAAKEILRIADFVCEMIKQSRQGFMEGDFKAIYKVEELEEIVNNVQGKTVQYLSALSGVDNLTDRQSTEISVYIHILSDFEHIGDHCINIAEFAADKIKKGYDFSDTAMAELTVAFDQIEYMMKATVNAFCTGDKHFAEEVMAIEDEVNLMETRLRNNHMKRLSERKCSPEFTVIFTDIVHNIEKIGDYCSNVARAVLNDFHFKKN